MRLTVTFYKFFALAFLLLILLSDVIVKATWWNAIMQAEKVLANNPALTEDLKFYSQGSKNWGQWTNSFPADLLHAG